MLLHVYWLVSTRFHVDCEREYAINVEMVHFPAPAGDAAHLLRRLSEAASRAAAHKEATGPQPAQIGRTAVR